MAKGCICLNELPLYRIHMMLHIPSFWEENIPIHTVGSFFSTNGVSLEFETCAIFVDISNLETGGFPWWDQQRSGDVTLHQLSAYDSPLSSIHFK